MVHDIICLLKISSKFTFNITNLFILFYIKLLLRSCGSLEAIPLIIATSVLTAHSCCMSEQDCFVAKSTLLAMTRFSVFGRWPCDAL